MSTSAGKGKKEEPEKKPRRRIKKVAGHGGHHGGSWKVAYADFVTAMMALFLVLWLLSQADTKLKQSIASYFRSPGVFTTQSGGVLGGPKNVSSDPSPDATHEENMFNEIAQSLKKRVSSDPEFSAFKDRVKVRVTSEGLNIQIVDKADLVTFESGSANLNPQAKELLAEIANSVCKLPNPISIGGHTDRRLFPQGSTYTNWELSADRANAARRELERNCVKPEQVHRVVGYADMELLYPNNPYAPGNRRIGITLLRMHALPKESEENDKEKIVEETPSAENKKKARASEAQEKSVKEKTDQEQETDSETKSKDQKHSSKLPAEEKKNSKTREETPIKKKAAH